jgi:glycosyltransferase involved in cell wall biosynthesis
MSKHLPKVDLIVPTLNEVHVLRASIERIRQYMQDEFPYPARVVVADNGSTDGTGDLAEQLAQEYEDVGVVRLNARGRGRALRQAWSETEAEIVAYTDVDISTELPALERLCRAIWEDGYDMAVGSRLMRESQTTRGLKREAISRIYNLLIKVVLWTNFSDAQCGCKAVSRRVVKDLMPLVQDEEWFFDTELLVRGEKGGYRIKDIPVTWVDDDDSRVKIVSTAWKDIQGVLRLRRQLWFG